MTDKEIYDSLVDEGLDPSGISAESLREYMFMIKNAEIENMFFNKDEKSVFLYGLRHNLSAVEMAHMLLDLS